MQFKGTAASSSEGLRRAGRTAACAPSPPHRQSSLLSDPELPSSNVTRRLLFLRADQTSPDSQPGPAASEEPDVWPPQSPRSRPPGGGPLPPDKETLPPGELRRAVPASVPRRSRVALGEFSAAPTSGKDERRGAATAAGSGRKSCICGGRGGRVRSGRIRQRGAGVKCRVQFV